LLLAIVIGFAVTVWRVVGLRTAVESPLSIAQVLWPGVAAVVAVYIFAWLGWALDID
jgi:hypothetical protein